MQDLRRFNGALLLSLLLLGALAACQTLQPGAPAVRVFDQRVEGGAVTVAGVASVGPGWIVIHADDAGKPGTVIGSAPVRDGVSRQVRVEIDRAAATRVLYAMLHADLGAAGVYEFPGADGPVMAGDSMVSPRFRILEQVMESSGGGGSY
jgi:hypothetical protein